jgi:hypothetical protein
MPPWTLYRDSHGRSSPFFSRGEEPSCGSTASDGGRREAHFLHVSSAESWRSWGGREAPGRKDAKMCSTSARRRRQLWPAPSRGRPPSRDRRTATGSSAPPSASRPSRSLPWSTLRSANMTVYPGPPECHRCGLIQNVHQDLGAEVTRLSLAPASGRGLCRTRR